MFEQNSYFVGNCISNKQWCSAAVHIEARGKYIQVMTILSLKLKPKFSVTCSIIYVYQERHKTCNHMH